MSSAAGGRITAGVGANLIGQHSHDRNQEATVYVGNLDPQMSEELVWELFIQAGPVVNVYLPKDRVTNTHQGYGFVEYQAEEDSDYAMKVLNMIKLYGKPIRVNKASTDKQAAEVGANLFIGNLSEEVDEKLLYDTFSAFGVIVNTPKLMRDPDTGNSRGFGFISFDCFEASDAAIEAMNGQYLCNRSIAVSYAFKKDTKGERHGTPAERLLAAQQKANVAKENRPHTMFATAPRQMQAPAPPAMGMYGAIPGMPPPPPMGGAPPMHGMMPPPPGAPGYAPPAPWGAMPGAPPQPWGAMPPPHHQVMMPPPPQGMMPPPHHGMMQGMPPQGMPQGMPPPPGPSYAPPAPAPAAAAQSGVPPPPAGGPAPPPPPGGPAPPPPPGGPAPPPPQQ